MLGFHRAPIRYPRSGIARQTAASHVVRYSVVTPRPHRVAGVSL
jgi:hypothetical protein